MKINHYCLKENDLEGALPTVENHADLVLIFASTKILEKSTFFEKLRNAYPEACIAGCSTAGEITVDHVEDDSAVISEITFDKAHCAVHSQVVADIDDSSKAAAQLARQCETPNLKAVMIFSPGVNVNGSAIIDGMVSVLGTEIPMSGGLAGDGSDFSVTHTVSNAGIHSDHIVAVCLYGDGLQLEYGSYGGWECFGPLRKVTRSKGNILYELDDQPALDLYKRYLGEYAKELPASALLFPLEMVSEEGEETGIIRTILGIDENEGSLTLAGDIEQGGDMRLMHASVDGLIDGAEKAASEISVNQKDRLALLISCVGRKLVMGDEVSEEIEAVRYLLGPQTIATGFYSYGEICPDQQLRSCSLHNQTMTITVLSEA